MKRLQNPKEQIGLHIATEAIAAFAIAPTITYIAYTNSQLPKWQRYALYAVAASTVVVDGFLLTQWLRK